MIHKKLVLISGPSGVGKTSVVQRLLKLIPNSARLITATTRPPRENEIHGKDYWFLTRKEFMEKVASGDFIEWVESYGNLYGTSHSKLSLLLISYSIVFVTPDTRGVFSLKNRFPESISIFIRHTSSDELVKRIRSRQTDPRDVSRRIIAIAEKMEHSRKFDYIVANTDGEFDKTVSMILEILDKHTI